MFFRILHDPQDVVVGRSSNHKMCQLDKLTT
jgi:hypothetical protein